MVFRISSSPKRLLVFIIDRDVRNFGDFPQFNEETNSEGNLHHEVCFIIANVQEDNDVLTHVPKYSSNLGKDNDRKVIGVKQ